MASINAYDLRILELVCWFI